MFNDYSKGKHMQQDAKKNTLKKFPSEIFGRPLFAPNCDGPGIRDLKIEMK